MIGRTAKLQVLAFVLVSVLGIAYVGIRYVGLGDRLLGGGYVVHVDLARAGGIFANAPVTYRGVPVGRVTAVNLHADGVRADLRINRGVRVPDALRAVVTQRSAVGEQYLDLRPDRDGGPFLADGAVIPVDRTGVPLAPETLLTNLDALVRSVDPADLTVLITELGTAFEGNEQALARILDAGDALLTDADARLPETLALIRDGRTVLTTQAESAEALRRWSAGLAQLAATVRAADPDLRRLLATGPQAGAELQALLRGLDPSIGTLLGNLVTVNGIAARRLPGIEQLLVVYPIAVAGGFTVTPGDGTAHLGLVVNAGDPPSCVYRGGGGRCSAGDRAAGASVRGAGNAPRPSGRPPAPAQPEQGSVSGYDPATGLVLGSDGRPLQFGGTGGQYRTAGDQSWKQLLLAGLTP
ncbi:phospholipid/cholesterol/gamma-HCH transport system substrate-binding protein [Micromonospora rhizosphaerae]|uniref:Phospholipid/cholesterol/gamma-HCH transport system substrate-binding protein n=1 Tax=Micromonospora rhizosphaerae TaxID=568872 RepID=A0A1C6SNL7_9ACTN|nr:MlaD family protein [Micromonospora rhizosphaerae]SCL30982.1 phospholipid/cholesterol/gamma-HCH transport system substrate-binding protein [Micromonospora rhizosphaerae]